MDGRNQTTLQHALFQSRAKSQNPFSRMDALCTQYGLLEEKCINVGERQEEEEEKKCSLTKHVTEVRWLS